MLHSCYCPVAQYWLVIHFIPPAISFLHCPISFYFCDFLLYCFSVRWFHSSCRHGLLLSFPPFNLFLIPDPPRKKLLVLGVVNETLTKIIDSVDHQLHT